jgi:hypothetical protein
VLEADDADEAVDAEEADEADEELPPIAPELLDAAWPPPCPLVVDVVALLEDGAPPMPLELLSETMDLVHAAKAKNARPRPPFIHERSPRMIDTSWSQVGRGPDS